MAQAQRFAVRRLTRLPDGRLGVIFVDAETGLEVSNLEGYQLISNENDVTGLAINPTAAQASQEQQVPTPDEPISAFRPDGTSALDQTFGTTVSSIWDDSSFDEPEQPGQNVVADYSTPDYSRVVDTSPNFGSQSRQAQQEKRSGSRLPLP